MCQVPNNLCERDEFDHIIAYSMFCTLENKDVSAMEYEELRFGSLYKAIKREDLKCLGQGKRCLEQGKKVLKEGIHALKEA